MNIVHSKTAKFITQIRHATQKRTTQHKQTSEVSKYQIISQLNLHKFQLQCYSKYSKWWPNFDHRRWNPCLHENIVCYQTTRHTHRGNKKNTRT